MRRFGPLTRPIALLQLQFCLALQLVFVLDAIIAGQSSNHIAALPIIDNATSALTRDASHCREIALTNLLADDSPSVAGVLTEFARQFE